MNGPLPISSFEAFAIVQLIGRGNSTDNVDFDVDLAIFLRICRGEMLEASLI
jgi:hypothetical protein